MCGTSGYPLKYITFKQTYTLSTSISIIWWFIQIFNFFGRTLTWRHILTFVWPYICRRICLLIHIFISLFLIVYIGCIVFYFLSTLVERLLRWFIRVSMHECILNSLVHYCLYKNTRIFIAKVIILLLQVKRVYVHYTPTACIYNVKTFGLNHNERLNPFTSG